MSDDDLLMSMVGTLWSTGRAEKVVYLPTCYQVNDGKQEVSARARRSDPIRLRAAGTETMRY